METSWYNFKTGEFEFRTEAPSTDEEAIQYIGQDGGAQGMYRVLRAMGKSIPDAMLYILKVQIGEKPE